MMLAELRTEVANALDTGLTGLIDPFSIHAYVPDELATPCVWIDSPIELRTYDVVELVAAVGVLIVVDGAEQSQLAALDALEGAAWVALETLGVATGALGVLLPAGGPHLHAVRLELEVQISARTLCTPALTTVTR